MYLPYSHLSPEDLQTRLNNGDKKAFDVIFELFWKRLYTYAYRIYPKEEICEDAVQEIFISLWERRKPAEIENLEAYLFRAVKYKMVSHLRNLKFTNVYDDAIKEIAVDPKIEKKLEFQELEHVVQGEIKKLAPRCRKVFILSRFEDFTNSEIANTLNISIRTVEKHISDALKHLRSSVEPY